MRGDIPNVAEGVAKCTHFVSVELVFHWRISWAPLAMAWVKIFFGVINVQHNSHTGAAYRAGVVHVAVFAFVGQHNHAVADGQFCMANFAIGSGYNHSLLGAKCLLVKSDGIGCTSET